MTRRLTARQSLALVLVLALGAGVVTAAALGRQSLAIALVGWLMVVTFGAVLQVGRRLGQAMEGLGSLRVLEGRRHLAMRKEIQGMIKEIQALHAEVTSHERARRRIVVAVETEREAAAERHEALLSSLSALNKEVQDERVAAAQWHQALLASLRNLREEMQRTLDET